ncbi:MAG: DUF4097 family beta strand repeat-containing protein [Saprospiraceae bacterium]
MKTILKLSFIFALLCNMILVFGQSEFTIPLSDPAKRGKLNAHLNSGSIIVKGTARKDVLVKYTSTSEKSEKQTTKDGLKRVSGGSVDLSGTENDNTVKVSSDSWNDELNLEIEVPIGFDVKMHTYNSGDLTISNVQGEIDLTNYNGAIYANNIKGSVVATTYNDDIKITFDEVKDAVPMAFSTYNGNIDVTFPSTIKASLKFKTDQGDIYSGFDIDIKSAGPVKKEDSKSGVYKVVVNEWKTGNINGGGAEMTFKNYNGDIYVRKK